MAHVNSGLLATRFAVTNDVLAFGDNEIGFRISACCTEDKFVDENIKQFTKTLCVVLSVDDPAIRLVIKNSLRAEFAPKEFRGVY